MQPIISFIVPIYNVEKYLKRCINSLINQTTTNIEIILIDDGSTDGCKDICDYFAEKDHRIVVIHKTNSGLGYARNAGIKIAKGKYISFIDSDDSISTDFAKVTTKLIEENNADLIEFNLKEVNTNNVEKIKYLKIKTGTYNKFDIDSTILKNYISDSGERIVNSVCTHLYKSDIIKKNNILFYSEREVYTEDFIFNLMYLKYVNKIVVIDEPLYNYNYNPLSLTKSYRNNYLNMILKRDELVKNILLNLYNRKDLIDFVDKKFLRISPSFIFNVMKLKGILPKNEIIIEINKIINSPELVKVLKKIKYNNLPKKKLIIYYLMKFKMPRSIYTILSIYLTLIKHK